MFYDFESEEMRDHVWKKILEKSEVDADGCRIWKGYLDSGGRPKLFININGKIIGYSVLRLSYQLSHVHETCTQQSGFTMKAICKKQLCFNPDHIRLDMLKKGWNPERVKELLIRNTSKGDIPSWSDKCCRLWQKEIGRGGYGRGKFCGQHMSAHLAAMLVKLGTTELPSIEGKKSIIRHKCTSKNCCEEDHLELGTHLQNSHDRIRDGTLARGEKHHRSKLSEKQALAIKMSRKPRGSKGYLSVKDRAAKFSVSKNIVEQIDSGRTWKHLPSPVSKKERAAVTTKKCERKALTEMQYNSLMNRIIKNSTVESQIPSHMKLPDRPTLTKPCRIWKGRTLNGYGVLSYQNRDFQAHVISCEKFHGRVTPPNSVVRHLCGRQLCNEEEHMTFGSNKDNMIDAAYHGTLSSKLNIEKVKQIRLSFTNGVSRKALAEQYKVCLGTIYSVISKKSWAYV